MSTQAEFGHIPQRTVGRRLRDAREDTGMSQAEFAATTGISRRTITRYEQSSDVAEMRLPNLLAWSFATGVPLVWLQTGEVPGPNGGGRLSRSNDTVTQMPSMRRRVIRRDTLQAA